MKKKLMCTVFLALLVPSMLLGWPVEAVSDDGLVGLWQFDEESGSTAVDDSGYLNDGEIVNADYVCPGMKSPSALGFDGDDDYVEIKNEANFDFEYSDAFTIGAWVKTGSGDVRCILGKIDNSTSPWKQGFLLFKSSGEQGNCVGFTLRHDRTSGNMIVVRGSTSIADGEWHHVFVTYDGSSRAAGVQIYVDGKLESMAVLVDALAGSISNDEALMISGSGSVSWKGELDAVRISRAAYHGEHWELLDAATLTVDHIFAELAGVIVNASDITLDLNGHIIIGRGPLYPDASTSPNFWYAGIFIGRPSSRTGVTITDTRGGGGVSNFNRGIGVMASNHNTIVGIEIHDNIDGIYFWFSSENTVDSNVIHNNERHGIKLFGISGALACLNQITNNKLAANHNGVFLQGGYANENVIAGNAIHGNVNGIRMQNDAIMSPGGYEDIGAPHGNSIEGNAIQGNDVGIDIEVADGVYTPRDVRDNAIQFNNISENQIYGIRTDVLTDAPYNWWGSPQGPTKGRGKLKGDLISPFVHVDPWLTEPV